MMPEISQWQIHFLVTVFCVQYSDVNTLGKDGTLSFLKPWYPYL